MLKAFLLFLAQGATTMTNAKTNTPGSLDHRLDEVIQHAMTEKRIIGTVVIVAKDGKVIYRKAHGLSDREAGKPMKEEAIFRFASLTKPITSITALRLVDRGILHLEDPVTKWLPDFKPKLQDGSTPVITIEQLLNHTAGLSYLFLEKQDGPYHQAGVFDGLADSGITLDVLGRVIEKASGKNLEEAVHELVTGPLQMKHTRFVAPKTWELVTPYLNRDPEPVRMGEKNFKVPLGSSEITFSPARAYDPSAYFSGGSGMLGTADDYLTFLEAIRKGALLNGPLMKKVFTNSTGSLPIPLAGSGWGWGLISALLLNPEKAKMPMGQDSLGWSGTYGHTWWIDPVNKYSVAILTNCAFEGMAGKFPEEIRAAVYK